MKTIHYLFIFSVFIITGSLFYACTKEQDNSLNATGEFEFAISASALKDENSSKGAAAYNLADADKIILTIQNNDGTPTKYTSCASL
ncbi:MAG TPA: hypothetical protein VMV47_17400 [Bacteroidales bacterium]|nr:hypothetical protein [Bacteroidales bacterium]